MSTLIERHLAKRIQYTALVHEYQQCADYANELKAQQKANEHYMLAFKHGIVADDPIEPTVCYAASAFIDWSTRVLQSIPDTQFSKFDRHLIAELRSQIERQIITIGTAEDILLAAIAD